MKLRNRPHPRMTAEERRYRAELRRKSAEFFAHADELAKLAETAADDAVATMSDEAGLAKYERMWREMYEAEIER